MGYRGKVEQQEQARALRLQGRTLADIAAELGVAKSSVSLWVRDLDVQVVRRPASGLRSAHPMHLAKISEIAALNERGRQRIGTLSDDAFLAAGIALYAGEGSKTDGKVLFANTSAPMIRFFCAWLRRFFAIDESRMRARVYLHQGLDLDQAQSFWSEAADIPLEQFQLPYRAVADKSLRRTKHEHGCAYVYYCCSRTHREIMGLVRALLSSEAIPG